MNVQKEISYIEVKIEENDKEIQETKISLKQSEDLEYIDPKERIIKKVDFLRGELHDLRRKGEALRNEKLFLLNNSYIDPSIRFYNKLLLF